MAALVAGKPDEALAAYAEMAKVSARGASIASMGRADLAMYQGRYADARAELVSGASSDEAANLQAPRALKLVALAEIAVATGSKDAAALLNQALALSKADAVVVPAGRMFAAIGRAEAARGLAADLEKQVQKRSRALGGVIHGELALLAKKPVEAIDAVTAARGLADLWLVRFTLGRAYVEAGKYAEAIAELEACEKRIGEASDVFLDDWPTFRYTAPLKYWLARAQDGLGITESATKNYQAYLDLRGAVRGDTLAADARKRTAARPKLVPEPSQRVPDLGCPVPDLLASVPEPARAERSKRQGPHGFDRSTLRQAQCSQAHGKQAQPPESVSGRRLPRSLRLGLPPAPEPAVASVPEPVEGTARTSTVRHFGRLTARKLSHRNWAGCGVGCSSYGTTVRVTGVLKALLPFDAHVHGPERQRRRRYHRDATPMLGPLDVDGTETSQTLAPCSNRHRAQSVDAVGGYVDRASAGHRRRGRGTRIEDRRDDRRPGRARNRDREGVGQVTPFWIRIVAGPAGNAGQSHPVRRRRRGRQEDETIPSGSLPFDITAVLPATAGRSPRTTRNASPLLPVEGLTDVIP